MSLADQLGGALAAGEHAAQAHSGEWLDKLLAKGLDLVEAQSSGLPAKGAPGGDGLAVDAERAGLAQAAQGLDAVAALRPHLLVLGEDLGLRALQLVGVGDLDAARRLARGAQAMTFAERRAAKAAATEQERAKTETRIAATEATIAAAKAFGLQALKAAIPFLVAAAMAL